MYQMVRSNYHAIIKFYEYSNTSFTYDYQNYKINLYYSNISDFVILIL